MQAELIEYTDEEVEENINELCGPVTIGNLTYDAGHVLKRIDRIAFDCWGSELPDRWKCGECEKVHDTENEADECCKPEEE